MQDRPPAARSFWRRVAVGTCALSLALIGTTLIFRYRFSELPGVLLLALLLAFGLVLGLLSRFLIDACREQRLISDALLAREQQVLEMAEHIQEVFWAFDVDADRPLYINGAYESLFGRSSASWLSNPLSCMELLDESDLARLREEFIRSWPAEQLDQQFRIIRRDGVKRWIRARAFPLRNAAGRVDRVVGTASDITSLVAAQQQALANLAKTEEAWKESDSLRRATLALTQDLRMDTVTNRILHELAQLVPCTCARIIIPQGNTHFLVLAEGHLGRDQSGADRESTISLNAERVPLLHTLNIEQRSVLCIDTAKEGGWRFFQGHQSLRSWIGVPLNASGQYLGFLSVGHSEPGRFKREDLRRAELLAIPAAAAIQNARLYARAQMYAEELERKIAELHQAEAALHNAIAIRKSSEETFRAVFRSSPVAFVITTVEKGVFLEVNPAFEAHYGYTRSELVAKMVSESSLWEDASERLRLAAEIKARGHIRGALTRLRTKSGAIKLTSYSADRIEFQEQSCILAVLAEAPPLPESNWN